MKKFFTFLIISSFIIIGTALADSTSTTTNISTIKFEFTSTGLILSNFDLKSFTTEQEKRLSDFQSVQKTNLESFLATQKAELEKVGTGSTTKLVNKQAKELKTFKAKQTKELLFFKNNQKKEKTSITKIFNKVKSYNKNIEIINNKIKKLEEQRTSLSTKFQKDIDNFNKLQNSMTGSTK